MRPQRAAFPQFALLLLALGLHPSGVQPLLGIDESFHSVLDLVQPYPLEQHYVTTRDGYILSVFRIPTSKPPGSAENTASATWPATAFARKLVEEAGNARKLLRPEGGSGGDPSASNSSSGASSSAGGVAAREQGRPVVLLQHGLLDSCAAWLLAGQPGALAFALADAGFDVWLGNSRGSTYSRAHQRWRLPQDSEQFWKFSWDDMAAYDLPALLSYITSHTGVQRVAYVGHSQGTTAMLAALSSTEPGSSSNSSSATSLAEQVASQLGLVVLLAPVATAKSVSSVPLQALAAAGTDTIFTLLGINEFLPSVRLVSWLEGGLCSVRPEMCISFLAALCGYRRHAVNDTRLPLILQYTPAGTSVQNMAHWAQAVRGDGSGAGAPVFRKFDYGTECGRWGRQHTCNQAQYGRDTPPPYELSTIPRGVRLALFTGGVDQLASPADTALLLEALPSGTVVSHTHLPDYEHLDFIWAMDASQRVYKPLLSLLRGDAGVRR